MDLLPRDRFCSQFPRSLDAKNRVQIPAKWRVEELGELFAVEEKSKGILKLLPKDEQERMGQMVLQSPKLSPAQARSFRRTLFASAVVCPLDKGGRVVLPQASLDAVGLGNDLMLVGAGELIEVWDPATWEGIQPEEQANFEEWSKEVFG